MPSTTYLLSLFLIFVRILAVMMTAPVFSSRTVPTIAKVGFAGLLAILLTPDSANSVIQSSSSVLLGDSPLGWLSLSLIIGKEILVGIVIGFVCNLVFVIVGMAASLMGLQIGFRAANLFDPMTTTPTSALDQFYSLMVMTLFLTINGHHWLLRAVSRSLEVTPLGMFTFQEITIERLIVLTGETFAAGARIALPIVASLLLADLGLGIIARAVPQIQVFFLGLPLKIGFGLVALALTLSLTLPLVKNLAGEMIAKALILVQ
jgi:flagellar biosynthesis protein FliR